MTRQLILACAALVAAPLVLTTHAAHACSCVEPQPYLLSPSTSHPAPLNARVRVALPKYLAGKLSLRKHRGAEIIVKRTDSPLPNTAHVELVPAQLLDADTRYEVALVNPELHPSTLVFGTFMTGNSTDTSAPLPAKISKTIVNGHRASAMTSCGVSTPWVEVSLSGARDPDRTDAQLLYAVWASNARGIIDLNAPPTAYLFEKNGKIKLGRISYCDPDEFPLPRQGALTLAIATIDEAGNRSSVQRVGLVMTAPVEANR